MQIDIKFIAKKAGVSPATVSRVMNHTKPVSPALRERVMAVIAQYHYHPNSMARGLILKKSCLIGIMTPNVSNAFHSKMIGSIEECACKQGYNVIVSNVRNDFDRQKESFMSLCERQVDGIIMLHENTGAEMALLRQISPVPLVLASIHIPDCTLPSAAIDDRQAAQDAVDYLIGLGHRRIAGIFNPCYSLGTLRRQGYETALRLNNIPIDPKLCVLSACTIEGGSASAAQLFAQSPPTALFCVSDEIAIGAIDWLCESGYRIPEDVSVMGFDDIILSKVLRPRLTTVHQPIKELGQAAWELLSRQMESPAPGQQILLPYHIVTRDSCKECVK